jgi:polar amino acid transport system ATP-binding protein
MNKAGEMRRSAPSSSSVLEVEGLGKTLGGRRILNNISFSLAGAEVKVLAGPSGAGKSTLLQCINYLIPPDEGTVRLEGTAVNPGDKEGLYLLRRKVGLVFQDFNLFDHLNVQENVSLALHAVKGLSRRDAALRAMMELERVGLSRRAGLYPAELSGSQRQRVAIARAVAMEPRVLLLDEPTSAQEPELAGEVLDVIRELASTGMTMILTTHHLGFIRAVAGGILFMDKGEILERGAPADLLTPGTRTRKFFSRIFAAPQ